MLRRWTVMLVLWGMIMSSVFPSPFSATAWAQAPMEPLAADDAVQLARPPAMQTPEGWDYLKPVANLLLVNGIMWVGLRYVLKKDYAYINLSTVGDNFAQGFVWDFDDFVTNQLGHPYQGGLYHAGARAVGFGFWGSIPYVALGSLQWEMFMENSRPSYNDLITTTVGGVAFGEVLFRLSSAFLDASSCGVERGAREGGALVVSPVFGVTRLVSGDATRDCAAGQRGPTQPVALRFAGGIENYRDTETRDSARNFSADVRVAYGSFEDDGESFAPFDWFRMMLRVNYLHADYNTADFDITGLLARWGFGCGDGNDCAWGPSMHYDFHESPVFGVGTSAVGATGLGRFELGLWSMNLLGQLDLQIIALGGFDLPYAEDVGRPYNLGSGLFGRATLVLSKPSWFQVHAFSSRYLVRTVKGVSGYEWAGITGVELEVPILWGFGLAGGLLLYDRTGIPDDYPRVSDTSFIQQLQVYWRL